MSFFSPLFKLLIVLLTAVLLVACESGTAGSDAGPVHKPEVECTVDCDTEPECTDNCDTDPECTDNCDTEPECTDDCDTEPECTEDCDTEPECTEDCDTEPECTEDCDTEPECTEDCDTEPECAEDCDTEPECTENCDTEPECTENCDTEPECTENCDTEPEPTLSTFSILTETIGETGFQNAGSTSLAASFISSHGSAEQPYISTVTLAEDNHQYVISTYEVTDEHSLEGSAIYHQTLNLEEINHAPLGFSDYGQLGALLVPFKDIESNYRLKAVFLLEPENEEDAQQIAPFDLAPPPADIAEWQRIAIVAKQLSTLYLIYQAEQNNEPVSFAEAITFEDNQYIRSALMPLGNVLVNSLIFSPAAPYAFALLTHPDGPDSITKYQINEEGELIELGQFVGDEVDLPNAQFASASLINDHVFAMVKVGQGECAPASDNELGTLVFYRLGFDESGDLDTDNAEILSTLSMGDDICERHLLPAFSPSGKQIFLSRPEKNDGLITQFSLLEATGTIVADVDLAEIEEGSNVTLTITPDSNATLDYIDGCNGVKTDEITYKIEAVNADCTVTAAFKFLSAP